MDNVNTHISGRDEVFVRREGVVVKTVVYVDVLLIINYIINLLLVLCTAKISGIKPQRRKIVAAALFGSLCSLTIFLPFLGFFAELLLKLAISALIVRIAMPYDSAREYLRRWFAFFAVNFFFAGSMLGIWMAFTPQWMMYYNGVVYFDISTISLIGATIAAYLLLSLMSRVSRAGRLQGDLCKVRIYLGERMCELSGLIDSGNSLSEPFSGMPVMVCWLEEVRQLMSPQVADCIMNGDFSGLLELDIPFRLVPYSAVGGGGVLPAFTPDKLIVRDKQGAHRVENVYVALSAKKVGDGRYGAILNPDMIRVKTSIGGVVKQ